MSDSQGNDTGLPSWPSLDTLALAEWLAARRAAGDVAPLSILLAALPDFAGELADATMDVMEGEADERPEETNKVEEPAIAPTLSPGAERAVAAIFGAEAASGLTGYYAAESDNDRREDALAQTRVAEAPAPYGAAEVAGLLALAHAQRMEAEALAAQIMLSPELLRWLDRIALPRERQPHALVYHLVGALGVTSERVRDALAQGEADAAVTDLVDTLTANDSLTATQRAYWAALLAEER